MSRLEHEGPELARIHRKNNDRKFFCHFTGFLEGVLASEHIEDGEVQPLLAECAAFVERVSDGDAYDIIEDFSAELADWGSIADVVEYRVGDIDPACPKSSLNRFLGFCRGICCDGLITLGEAKTLLSYLEAAPNLLEYNEVAQVQVCCLDAVEDGVVTNEESDEITVAISNIVGDSYGDTGIAAPFGVANFEEYRPSTLAELRGSQAVLTGRFQTSPRSDLESRLLEVGLVFSKSVSGKTDIIIVGGEASRDWIEQNRGTKIRKAQSLRSKSGRPNFVSEAYLLRLMGT